ncbi:MAG: hypothetical protein AB7O44_33290 [Hyphomicrobiaceae bacterium]
MKNEIAFATVSACKLGHTNGLLTLVGTDKSGAEVSVSLSIAMYAAITGEVQRAIYTSSRPTGLRKHADGWQDVASITPKTVSVGTLATGPDVVLSVDRGTPQEIAFRLPPDVADHVAQKLLRESENCRTGLATRPRGPTN